MAEMEALSSEAVGRSDLVVLQAPGRESLMVKRVAAVGGERIEIDDGTLRVGGEAVPYPVEGSAGMDFRPQSVPAGSVFVLGDNLADSLDGRRFGPVPIERLVGRPLYVYWSSDRSRISYRLAERADLFPLHNALDNASRRAYDQRPFA